MKKEGRQAYSVIIFFKALSPQLKQKGLIRISVLEKPVVKSLKRRNKTCLSGRSSDIRLCQRREPAWRGALSASSVRQRAAITSEPVWMEGGREGGQPIAAD